MTINFAPPEELAELNPPEIPESSDLSKIGPLDLGPIRSALTVYDPQIVDMEQEASALAVQDDVSMARAVELATKAKSVNAALEKRRKFLLGPAQDFVKSVNSLFKSFQERFKRVEEDLRTKTTTYQRAQELARSQAEEAARRAQAEAQTKLDAEIRAENAKRRAEAEATEKAAREAKEAAEKAAREAKEAQTKKNDAEARRLSEEAATAQEAATQAEEAARMAAQAPEIAPITIAAPVVPASASTVRTEFGSAHIRKTWKHEIVDAAQIPRAYLVVDEAAIRRAVKDGIREIPGVRIFEEADTVFRK